MKKTTLLIFTLIISATILSVSGDVPTNYLSERTLTVAIVPEDASLIKLIPNAPYVFLDENGKLRIEISKNSPNFPGFGSGVAPDTRHAFDCVFKIRNDLWTNKTIIFKIDSSSDSLLLYSDKSAHRTPETAARSLQFKLEWKEYACVGIVVDSAGRSVGATIEVEI